MAMVGRPRKLGVERTASGNIKYAMPPKAYCVYLIYEPFKKLFKVGCTGDLKNRLRHYKRKTGKIPIVVGQFRVSDVAVGLDAEAESVNRLARAGYKRHAKEWFEAPLDAGPAILAIVQGSCAGCSLGSQTMGDESEMTARSQEMHDLRRQVFGHRIAFHSASYVV